MAAPSLVEQAAALLTASGFGAVAIKLVDVWQSRRARLDAEPADLTRAAADLQEALTAGGKELLEEFRREFRFLRGRVAELTNKVDACEGHRDECEASLRDVNRRLDDSERDRAELKAQIGRLMGQPPADY